MEKSILNYQKTSEKIMTTTGVKDVVGNFSVELLGLYI